MEYFVIGVTVLVAVRLGVDRLRDEQIKGRAWRALDAALAP